MQRDTVVVIDEVRFSLPPSRLLRALEGVSFRIEEFVYLFLTRVNTEREQSEFLPSKDWLGFSFVANRRREDDLSPDSIQSRFPRAERRDERRVATPHNRSICTRRFFARNQLTVAFRSSEFVRRPLIPFYVDSCPSTYTAETTSPPCSSLFQNATSFLSRRVRMREIREFCERESRPFPTTFFSFVPMQPRSNTAKG